MSSAFIGTYTQQTRDIDPMLIQWWPTVYDAGPTSCLPGIYGIVLTTLQLLYASAPLLV